ncbi:MAG TPA: hypothetical protein V6D22_05080 [Candidatus Obscuribacterales bacterium]
MISSRLESIGAQVVETAAGQQPSDTSEMSSAVIKAKSSPALPIWAAVIVVVLAALWLQMSRGTGSTSYNFLIEGGPESVGATVILDGKPVGTLRQYSDAGVNMVGLRLHVSDGVHNIEVNKSGYLPQSKQVILKGEDYVGVELKPSGADKPEQATVSPLAPAARP